MVNSDVMDVYSSLKKAKPPRKTQKNNNPLKIKRILHIKMSAKGGQFLHLAYQGGRLAPAPLSYATESEFRFSRSAFVLPQLLA